MDTQPVGLPDSTCIVGVPSSDIKINIAYSLECRATSGTNWEYPPLQSLICQAMLFTVSNIKLYIS